MLACGAGSGAAACASSAAMHFATGERPVHSARAAADRRPRLALARSAGRYDGSLRRIVHAFKYDGRRVLAAPLGALLRDAGADCWPAPTR